jgi:O-acetylserine/cysteine efflux transporter
VRDYLETLDWNKTAPGPRIPPDAPLLLLSAWLEPQGWGSVANASWVAWGGVIYSALVASVLGHGLFYWLIQRHPVSRLMPYLLLAPLFAIALGVLFHGDTLGPRLILGGAMVLGGVLAIGVRTHRTARPAPVPSDA